MGIGWHFNLYTKCTFSHLTTIASCSFIASFIVMVCIFWIIIAYNNKICVYILILLNICLTGQCIVLYLNKSMLQCQLYLHLIIKNKKLMFRYDFEMHLLYYTCAAILASLYCLYGKISNNII